MSLQFNYKLEAFAGPVVSLGGRFVRPRSLVLVTLIGPAGSRARNGLLDTGADDTVFPEALAAKVGVDLTNAPLRVGCRNRSGGHYLALCGGDPSGNRRS